MSSASEPASPSTPGTIGVISTDLARYSWFADSLLAQQHFLLQCLPPDMLPAILWEQGHWIPAALNRLIRRMPATSTFVQLYADDHRFEGDTLLRLLAHQVAIVAPLCALRRPPFNPSIFFQTAPGYTGYTGCTWKDLDGRTGLLEVDATGGPGMVIRREVLDALGDPWFENYPGSREYPCDELYFCEKVRAAGYRVFVDLDTSIEHITSMSLVPRRCEDGRWEIGWWSYGGHGTLTHSGS